MLHPHKGFGIGKFLYAKNCVIFIMSVVLFTISLAHIHLVKLNKIYTRGIFGLRFAPDYGYITKSRNPLKRKLAAILGTWDLK